MPRPRPRFLKLSFLALCATALLIQPIVAEPAPDAATTAGQAVTDPAPSPTSTPTPPPASPVAQSMEAAIGDKAVTSGANADDLATVQAVYKDRSEFLFTGASGWSDKGAAIIAELKKADDYGLEAAAFPIPDLTAGADVTAQGQAETRLALAALKYARFARGGRFNPQSTSNILDVRGEIKDPAAVISELASSSAPDAVLRGLHPQHKEFEALRQALLKARAPAQPTPEPEIDPALKIKLPEGKQIKILKVGVEHDDVVLLRQRLKVSASAGASDRLYDASVETAVAAFQEANGLKATGALTARTRQALNREGEPKPAPEPSRIINQLVINMERWRWLPADLGPLYVMDNIPEFMTRVVKGGEVVFEEKIIVGLPTWPTPMLSDQIEKVVFNPEWGVPDGIKVKELLPRLRQAGGGDFFEQLFGGGFGGGGGGRVLAAYGLRPSLNGRPIDANSVNWSSVDIRRYSFTQPPGPTNPLGTVKFMFPNRHDVYMHDTSQKPLFAQTRRALSHGCIRVENPRKLAELLLAEDKGWTPDQVSAQYRGSNEVLLDKPVPVHLTYFTARVGADGKVISYEDIYGHDSRLVSALAGRPVRYEPPEQSADDFMAEGPPAGSIETSSTKKKGRKTAKSDSPGDLISNALSGLLFN